MNGFDVRGPVDDDELAALVIVLGRIEQSPDGAADRTPLDGWRRQRRAALADAGPRRPSRDHLARQDRRG